ncbi:extracellular solute-binding protein [Halostagnicola sp. A56]|uniref:extracellular solute-binding protein n=1 Tax=Halostagnicola sp. A56 TaxID=1495067 RepID=UPI000679C382|nr:extracellular solute-binding protein [Halostagnicola sp. A56]
MSKSGSNDDETRRRSGRGYGTRHGRRKFLTLAGSTAGALALAGCITEESEESTYSRDEPIPDPKTYTTDELFNFDEWRNSGELIEDRPTEYTGRSMLDLPDLRGELTVYLGGGEGGLYENLMWKIQQTYKDFTVNVDKASSSNLANTISEEVNAGQSPADIFWAIDAGSIGIVAENDATVELPTHLVEDFRTTPSFLLVFCKAISRPGFRDERSSRIATNDSGIESRSPSFIRVSSVTV